MINFCANTNRVSTVITRSESTSQLVKFVFFQSSAYSFAVFSSKISISTGGSLLYGALGGKLFKSNRAFTASLSFGIILCYT